MQADNEEKEEFKLSFKPSSASMNMNNTNNGSANQQWSSSITNTSNSMQYPSQFMNQSSSSIMLSGYNNEHINNNKANNNNNMNNKTTVTSNNLSMFAPQMNLSMNDNLNSSHCHVPTDSEVIFYESVPIIVKVSMMETNTRHLTLKIEKVVQLPQNQAILSITLTDEV